MNRRKMVGSLALAGLTASFPFKEIVANNVKEIQEPGKYIPFKRFQLGELELTIITDGHIIEKPVQPGFAPGVPKEQVDKILVDNFRSTEEAEMGMQVLLIKKGKQLIMLDTGFGQGLPTGGMLQDALKSAGFSPTHVTDIFLSHAHPDHIGGLFGTNDTLVFKNAKLYISKIEYEFWMQAMVNDFKNSVLKDMPDLLEPLLVQTKKRLGIMKAGLQFFKGGDMLFDCIEMVAAPGHTPGLTLMKLSSGNERLIYIADLIHSDVLLFPHPEWGFSGDTDLTIAAKTRRTMLEKLANEKISVFAYHLPWPGLGHVRKKDKAFEWIPQVFAIP